MTVRDICEAFIDKENIIVIWSLENGNVLFHGTCSKILKSDLRGQYIVSMKIENGVLNVNV